MTDEAKQYAEDGAWDAAHPDRLRAMRRESTAVGVAIYQERVERARICLRHGTVGPCAYCADIPEEDDW